MKNSEEKVRNPFLASYAPLGGVRIQQLERSKVGRTEADEGGGSPETVTLGPLSSSSLSAMSPLSCLGKQSGVVGKWGSEVERQKQNSNIKSQLCALKNMPANSKLLYYPHFFCYSKQ